MMDKGYRSILSIVAIVALGAMALYPMTRGYRAVSAESARRVDLMRQPRPLTPLAMIDQAGEQFLLPDIAAARTWTVATLVYTQCFTICRTSSAGLAYLQEALEQYGLSGKVRFLTLSFDPVRDTPSELSRYARRQGARAGIWRFATVASDDQLASMLDLFDIVVLPDGLGGYSHNAALFLIDGAGRIVRAYDVDRPDHVLADLVRAEQCCV